MNIVLYIALFRIASTLTGIAECLLEISTRKKAVPSLTNDLN